jgi:ribonuclease HI
MARAKRLIVYADGAIRRQATGVGVVVRDEGGAILGWHSKQLSKAMTCNEAEYAALLFAMEVIGGYRTREVQFRLDSQVVVNQVWGIFNVRHPALRRCCEQVRRLTARLGKKVTFIHIPREKNRLADALANDAAEDGQGLGQRLEIHG